MAVRPRERDRRGRAPYLAEDLVAEAFTRAQALAANGVPALLHFGGSPCSADRAPRRGPIGLAQGRATGGTSRSR